MRVVYIGDIDETGDTDMTNTAAKEVFNRAIAATTDADAIARLEVAREYLTNPDFRAKLQEHLWLTRKQ